MSLSPRAKLVIMMLATTLMANGYGCAAALIGGAFYKGSKTKGQRQQFTSQFQQTNMERESKGLKPLDWCTEAYRFDEGFANNDKECAKRIKAYKKGYTSALDIAPAVPATTKTAP